MEKYTLKQIKMPIEKGGWVQILLNIANELAISNGHTDEGKYVKLNKKENEFFEEAYACLVKLGVHEDSCYGLVKGIMRRHFERLQDIDDFR